MLDKVFERVQRCVREFSLLTDFLRIFGVISPCKGFFQNDILDDFADTLCMRTGYGKIKATALPVELQKHDGSKNTAAVMEKDRRSVL